KGTTLAIPRTSREHCHLFLERRCPGAGEAPRKFFGCLTTPATIEDALDDVVDGMAQAAILDSVSLERYEKANPERFARLKVLCKSEPFPAAVVAYRTGGLSDDTLQRFKDGMMTANQNKRGQQLLELCKITCFEDVPANYDQMLLDIAKAYPPPP